MSDPDSTDLPPSWLRQVEELLNRLRRVEEYVQEMVERQREKQENGGGEDGDGNGNGDAGENGGDG